MVVPLAVRWSLTVVFAGAGAYCVLRCALPATAMMRHRLVDRLSDLAHVAMNTSMITMLWTWWGGDRWGLQLTFFALAMGWFLVRAVDPGSRSAQAIGHCGPRLGMVHQGVAMAAMLWMILSMPAPGGPGASRSAMSMGAPEMGAHHVGPLSPSALPATVTTLGLAGYLAVAAIWWAGRYRAATVGPPTANAAMVFGIAGDAACQALMTAAMSLTLVILL
jgi:hypothetical protein